MGDIPRESTKQMWIGKAPIKAEKYPPEGGNRRIYYRSTGSVSPQTIGKRSRRNKPKMHGII